MTLTSVVCFMKRTRAASDERHLYCKRLDSGAERETMICQLLQKMQQFMNENRLQEYKSGCCKKCNNLSKGYYYTLLLRDK